MLSSQRRRAGQVHQDRRGAPKLAVRPVVHRLHSVVMHRNPLVNEAAEVAGRAFETDVGDFTCRLVQEL